MGWRTGGLAALAAALLFSACGDGGAGPDGAPEPYPQYMRDFVGAISAYAKAADPGFLIVPQNGAELLTGNLEPGGPPASAYLDAIDGQGQEDLFFGYAADDQETPSAERDWMLGFLGGAEQQGVQVMVTDYCWTQWKVDSSYSWNSARGFVSFAADHRDLDDIPPYPSEPWGFDLDPVTGLAEAGNFLYLINDQNYSSAEEFVDEISATGYDMLVVDLFCCGAQLDPAQVWQLGHKPGGADRIVLCYMSIGEAEDYRWYWQPSWETDPPGWLGPENPDWPGNYLVEYWDPGWQAIIYGSSDAYLDRILDAGFDGVYLDKIDAFESW
jgi:cysteinyl-tRNA synthetase